jgi:hypothetical protein
MSNLGNLKETPPVSVFTNVDQTEVIPELNPGLLNEQPAFSFLCKSANFGKQANLSQI